MTTSYELYKFLTVGPYVGFFGSMYMGTEGNLAVAFSLFALSTLLAYWNIRYVQINQTKVLIELYMRKSVIGKSEPASKAVNSAMAKVRSRSKSNEQRPG